MKYIYYLKNNNIDILGLQEVYSKLNNDLEQELSTTKYKIYGKYRFYLHTILKRFNEKVPIVTNKKTIFNKTYSSKLSLMSTFSFFFVCLFFVFVLFCFSRQGFSV